MQIITFGIFLVIFLVVTIFFKVIDHITDFFVNKTYKNKKGISSHNGKLAILSILGIAPNKDISSEFFDEMAIKWGLSRDFLVFKNLMGQGTNIEKEKLSKWESILNGDKIEF